jgi:hypothetical protein
MPDVTIDDRELRKLMRKISRASKGNQKFIKRMLKIIGSIVHGKAKAYAPRSATKAEYESTLKGGKTKRATSSFTTNNLKKSITTEVKRDRVEIGVPSNSPAGDYAEKMHDDKGKSWKKLGKHNDGKATDKYIFKAYADSEKEIMGELDTLLDNIVKGIFK